MYTSTSAAAAAANMRREQKKRKYHRELQREEEEKKNKTLAFNRNINVFIVIKLTLKWHQNMMKIQRVSNEMRSRKRDKHTHTMCWMCLDSRL